MTLKNAIPVIEKLYSSIAVKTLLLKIDEDWINLFTVILPTRRAKSDLIEEYDNLEKRIGKIDFENIKVKFEIRDIDDFFTIIDEIESGYLSLGDFHTKYVQDTSKIKTEQFRHSAYHLRFGELSEYESYCVISGFQKTVGTSLIDHGISPRIFGLDNFDDVARSWFHVDGFNYAMTILIIIPVYAKIISLQYGGGEIINVDLKIDESIIKNSQLWVMRKGGRDRSPIIERKFYDVFSLKHIKNENFYFVHVDHKFQGINSNDVIEAMIQHDELGLIAKNDLRMEYLSRASEYPLLDAYKLFEASQMLKDNLEDPSDDKAFETAVCWFLELIGFHTIKLENGEIIRENGVNKGSADILFYDNELKTIFVVDCTIGVPPPNKIDKIKNTSNYISRSYNFPIKPIIFSPKLCSSVKTTAKEIDVKIVDLENILELKQIFQLGYLHLPRARRLITD